MWPGAIHGGPHCHLLGVLGRTVLAAILKGDESVKDYIMPFILSLAVFGVGIFVLDWGLMNLQGLSLVFHQ